MSNVNQLSPKLAQKLKDATPKKGQTVCFVSVRPSSRGTTVLPYDTIYDPFADNGTDVPGANVDIAFVTGSQVIPGPDPISKQPSQEIKYARNLGRIQLRKGDGGRIYIHGGNSMEENMFRFLYLTNQLTNNQDQPWFIRKPGRQMVVTMKEPSKSAKELVDFKRKVRTAGEAIDAMSDAQLRDFAIGLELKLQSGLAITKHTEGDEIRVGLLKIADLNPDKIITLDKDLGIKAKADIRRALDFKIIELDTALNTYVWADTGESVCVVPPGNKGQEILANFLIGKGSKVYSTIKQLIDKEIKKKEEKA